MSYIEALVRLRVCLFRYAFCRRESSKTCYFSTVLILLLLTTVSVNHIYCRPIELVSFLGQICQYSLVTWKLYYNG